MRQLVDYTADAVGLSSRTVLEPSRYHEHVRTRQAISFVAARKLKMSYSQIARVFGQDHSTVLHAVHVLPSYLAEPSGAALDAYRAAAKYVAQRKRQARVVDVGQD